MIVKNAAKCGKCGDEVESKHRHDFVSCKCGGIFVDGGKNYLRRGTQDGAELIELAEFTEDE